MAARLAVGEERGVVMELKQLVAENPGRERLSEYHLTEAGKEFINAITHPLSFPAEAVAASSEGRR